MGANMFLHIAALFVAVIQEGAAGKPGALRALEESRKSSVISGRIDWSVLPKGDEEGALAFVSRFAKNGDTIFEHRGDRDGWTIFEPGTRRGKQKYPLLYMTNGDGYWEYKETTPGCGLWKHDGEPNPFSREVKEILGVGAHATTASLKSDVGLGAIWQGMRGTMWEIVSWEQTKDGADYVVTASFDSGARMTWHIDPARGWNAERVVLVESNGRTTREAVCTLKEYDDVWLPETTTYLRKGEVVEVVQIRSASLNQPDDAACFTGADLGLEAGVNIVLKNEPVEVGKPPVWNGEGISSWDQWVEDVESGKRQPGPMFQKINRGEGWDSPYSTEEERLRRRASYKELSVQASLKSHEGLWLRYVRDFIKRYDLNDEQSQKAMAILRECQDRADQLLAHEEPELTVLALKLQEAQKNHQREAVRRLMARVKKLREPIDGIFETQLKPRLDKLPTRAQRKAVEKPPSEPSDGAKKP